MMDNVNANQELRDNSAMLVTIPRGILDLQDVRIVIVCQKEMYHCFGQMERSEVY